MTTALSTIHLDDKSFVPYIPEQRIREAVAGLAHRINDDLKGKRPLFLVVLNGAFLFAADLLRDITIECELSFVKLASYHGTSSTGAMKQLIGLNEDLAGRTIVIVEDIVDTGFTMETLVGMLKDKHAAEIRIATLLFKPHAYKRSLHIDYVGLEIPDAFIVGYGLDYNGLGRNLKDIWVVSK